VTVVLLLLFLVLVAHDRLLNLLLLLLLLCDKVGWLSSRPSTLRSTGCPAGHNLLL